MTIKIAPPNGCSVIDLNAPWQFIRKQPNRKRDLLSCIDGQGRNETGRDRHLIVDVRIQPALPNARSRRLVWPVRHLSHSLPLDNPIGGT